jgi:osmotically-inducible protein OsmY
MDGAVRMMDIATRDVENRAKSALASSPIYILRELHVEIFDDCLLLSGRVDSFYHKQLAQEVVRAVAGGMKVINDVDVD